MSNENTQQQVQLKDWTSDKDLMAKVGAMTEGEMKTLLLGLASRPEWPAILRWSMARFAYHQSGLVTMDPAKQPSEMARIQGFLGGVQDLQNVVGQLILAAEKAEKPTV